MIEIYTDGSTAYHYVKKGLWRSSWAFIIAGQQDGYNGLLKVGDINIAELVAVQKALEKVKNSGDKIIIHTDSWLVNYVINIRPVAKYRPISNQITDLMKGRDVWINLLGKKRPEIHWKVHNLARKALHDYLASFK